MRDSSASLRRRCRRPVWLRPRPRRRSASGLVRVGPQFSASRWHLIAAVCRSAQFRGARLLRRAPSSIFSRPSESSASSDSSTGVSVRASWNLSLCNRPVPNRVRLLPSRLLGGLGSIRSCENVRALVCCVALGAVPGPVCARGAGLFGLRGIRMAISAARAARSSHRGTRLENGQLETVPDAVPGCARTSIDASRFPRSDLARAVLRMR